VGVSGLQSGLLQYEGSDALRFNGAAWGLVVSVNKAGNSSIGVAKGGLAGTTDERLGDGVERP
jgi:hypothetical protein